MEKEKDDFGLPIYKNAHVATNHALFEISMTGKTSDLMHQVMSGTYNLARKLEVEGVQASGREPVLVLCRTCVRGDKVNIQKLKGEVGCAFNHATFPCDHCKFHDKEDTFAFVSGYSVCDDIYKNNAHIFFRHRAVNNKWEIEANIK